MQTAGATWYIDEEKTWAVSALNRYEFNTEQRDTHVTPGDAYTLEWGVSKTVAKVVDLGAVGYYQQQVTGNSDGSAPQPRGGRRSGSQRGFPEADVLRLAPLQLRIHGGEPGAGQRRHLDPHEAVLNRVRKTFPDCRRAGRLPAFFMRRHRVHLDPAPGAPDSVPAFRTPCHPQPMPIGKSAFQLGTIGLVAVSRCTRAMTM